jgi:hypothetical protein
VVVPSVVRSRRGMHHVNKGTTAVFEYTFRIPDHLLEAFGRLRSIVGVATFRKTDRQAYRAVSFSPKP